MSPPRAEFARLGASSSTWQASLGRWRVLLVNRASLPPTVRYESLPATSSKRHIEIDLYSANVTTQIELIACPMATTEVANVRIRKCESCQILARRRPQRNPIDATFHTVCLIFAKPRRLPGEACGQRRVPSRKWRLP